MSVKIIEGNIFNSDCHTVVNTVNCVGVMGKGIALTYRYLLKDMYTQYKDICQKKQLCIGKLWIYKHRPERWILNFPTKEHWKYPSQLSFLEMGLEKFCHTYEQKGIRSVAFPLLGTYNGGLDEDQVLALMLEYLQRCRIEVEIYKYVPQFGDKIIDEFKQIFVNRGIEENGCFFGISRSKLLIIETALKDEKINSIIDLANINGVGEQTLKKIFKQLTF